MNKFRALRVDCKAAFLTDGFISLFHRGYLQLVLLPNHMKILLLLALVALVAAFDFPEEWEAWKKV